MNLSLEVCCRDELRPYMWQLFLNWKRSNKRNHRAQSRFLRDDKWVCKDHSLLVTLIDPLSFSFPYHCSSPPPTTAPEEPVTRTAFQSRHWKLMCLLYIPSSSVHLAAPYQKKIIEKQINIYIYIVNYLIMLGNNSGRLWEMRAILLLYIPKIFKRGSLYFSH